MAQTAGRREGRAARRAPLFGEGHHGAVRRLGNDALRFARWFFRSKYQLMAGFLGELESAPEARDEGALRERFCRAVTHAVRVQRLRSVVTALLALGVVTAAFAAVVEVVSLPASWAGDVAATRALLASVAAWSASASAVLVALRLAFDRYLGLVDVSATFLAIEIASSNAGRAAP
jgi:predicted anti-sigma-YlaC factor YlaD